MKIIKLDRKSTRPGTLPTHFDLMAEGDDDSIITIWCSGQMAEFLAECLGSLDPAFLAHLMGARIKDQTQQV